MNKHLQIGILGLLISFLGALPLGTLNITAFQIAVFHDVSNALWFASGVVLVEILAVRLTLSWTKNIDFSHKAFFYILPLIALVLLYLSFNSFVAIVDGNTFGENPMPIPEIKSSFFLGLFLSTLNPMHLPFWMSWNNVLRSKQKLLRTNGIYVSYLIGIGLGSIGGLLIFILLGNYFLESFNQFVQTISLIIGCIYFSFAVYMIFSLYRYHFKLKTL